MKLHWSFHLLAPLALILLFGYASLAWQSTITTHFFVPLGLFLFLAFVPVTWARKQIVGLHSRTKRFLIQYLFTSSIAVLFAWGTGALSWDSRILIVAGVGFIQAFGTYAKWKADELSLAKSSLFTFWDDFTAMGLSAWILHEWQMLNALTMAGVAICIGVTSYFVRNAYLAAKAKETGKEQVLGTSFYGYVAFYSVVWGIAMFCERYFSFNELLPGHFAIGWYGGALMTALIIFLGYKDPSESQQVKSERLSRHDVLFMFYYASGIVLCLMLGYVVLHTTPLNVSQPLILIGEAVGGMWIGLYVFKEGRQFTQGEKVASAVAIVGVALIGYSTYISR